MWNISDEGGGLWFNGWLNYKKIEIKEKGAPKALEFCDEILTIVDIWYLRKGELLFH